jgi:PAS domain S-box-containing protein
MSNWVKQQIESKLFRRIFYALLAASLIPIFLLLFFLYQNGGHLAENWAEGLLTQFMVVVVLALLLAGIFGFYLSRYFTTPISHITDGATKIARGNFSHQINVSGDDEVGRLAKLFNYMTTELRRLDAMNLSKIIAERNKTQTIIKNIADGVIVTDPKSRILIINNTIEKIFGLKQEKVFEKPLQDFITEPKLAQLFKEAEKRNVETLPAVEISIKLQDEWKNRILQARAARVQQDDGTLVGIVTILRDITEQKEIDRMKTELVSMVAHELRSPLTSISGFSELLLDEDISKTQTEEYATIIVKEANRLSDLINKFLDISRIESGRIQPNKTKLDIYEIVQMVVGNNSYLASRKGILVEIHESSKNMFINADSGMMEQVFLNLFSNAIKYSPDNTRIDIVFKSNEENISVEIHDQGFGMNAKALKKIFEKFYRVTEDEKVRDIPGTGLGLPLAKQIIEMHNGRIEVESKVDRGSVFSVWLPHIGSQQNILINQNDYDEIIH